MSNFLRICQQIQSAIDFRREFLILNKSDTEEDEDSNVIEGASMEMFWLSDGAREIFVRINVAATLGGIFDDAQTRQSTIAPLERG